MHVWFVQPVVHMPGWSRDACGYLAALLVLSTFSVRSMRQLRWFGIASNVAFISYALLAAMPPILLLHSLLLPMNIYRLLQLERASWAGRFLASGGGRSGS